MNDLFDADNAADRQSFTHPSTENHSPDEYESLKERFRQAVGDAPEHPKIAVDRDTSGRFRGRSLTRAEKAFVLDHPSWSHAKLANFFKCSRSQVSNVFAADRRSRAKA
jgi:hypothetical protein